LCHRDHQVLYDSLTCSFTNAPVGKTAGNWYFYKSVCPAFTF